MKFKFLSLLVSVILLSSCTGESGPADPNPTPHDTKEGPGIFSKDGNLLDAFGQKSSGSSITVNQYIWRSSLQAISFMPIVQADSSGGVILSDWIEQENDPDKQVKINIYILGKKLSSNALEIKVFTRSKLENGRFSSPKEDPLTARALEETILSNARALKIKGRA